MGNRAREELEANAAKRWTLIRQIAYAGDGNRFGACERCGKACNSHYKQMWRPANQQRNGWYLSGFGHLECLRVGRYADAAVIEQA